MSSIVEVSQAPTEPVDLTTAQTFLRVQPGTDDTLISTIIIPGARRQLETSLGMTLANRKFIQMEPAFPLFPYYSSPYAAMFGSDFPIYFGGYGPAASYPYPASGSLRNRRNPFEIHLLRGPATAIDHIEYIGTDGKSHGLLPGSDFAVDLASMPPRIAPLPGQRWPISVQGLNSVKIYFSAGYFPPNTADVSESLGAVWSAFTSVAQNSYFLDPAGNVWIQLATNAKTGKTEPGWTGNPGTTFSETNPEGVVTATWQNLGPILGPWTSGHVYTAPAVIVDPNGYLQQLIVSSLTAGGSTPTFSQTFGAISNDNSVPAWRNIGQDQSQGATDPANETTSVQLNNSIPPNLYTALLQMIVHWYQQRAVVVTSAGAGGTHVPLPLHLQEIINSERVLEFGLNE